MAELEAAQPFHPQISPFCILPRQIRPPRVMDSIGHLHLRSSAMFALRQRSFWTQELLEPSHLYC